MVPLAAAAGWVLENRPLPPSWETDEEGWLSEGLVRVAPAAEEGFYALRDPVRARLVASLGRLRSRIAGGHVIVREGQVWALAAFEVGGETVTLLGVGRRVELERLLLAQPM